MSSLMTQDKVEAKKKGYLALGTAVASGTLLALNAPILGAGAAAGAAYFTYKWFMYRAKRGMRF